jgi:hypothetical protein
VRRERERERERRRRAQVNKYRVYTAGEINRKRKFAGVAASEFCATR